MSATASSRTAAPAPEKTERFRNERFWNWKLIGIEVIATALAVCAFLACTPGFPGWAGLIAGALIVLSLSREFRGLVVDSRRGVSFPRGRLAGFPILSLGRRLETGTASLRVLVVLEPWYGFQVVEIEGWFGSELLVFQSRDQRLRFMSAFEEICPDVPIRKAGAKRR
jgi:hypothetical protein